MRAWWCHLRRPRRTRLQVIATHAADSAGWRLHGRDGEHPTFRRKIGSNQYENDDSGIGGIGSCRGLHALRCDAVSQKGDKGQHAGDSDEGDRTEEAAHCLREG